MPADIYTKAALTVIAVALSVIAGNQLLAPADARTGCGENEHNPCYVRGSDAYAQRVWVENWP